jgi:hypothetical protein
MSSQSHNTRISVPKAHCCRSSWAELVQVRAARAVHDAATAAPAPPAHRRRRRKDQLLRHRSGRHLCCAVAATITSHSCAAEVNVSKLCRDGRFHHLTPPRGHQRPVAVGRDAANLRTSGPMGVTGMPRLSTHSRKSGGTQTLTSWPSAFKCGASATTGWTSPRDPIAEDSYCGLDILKSGGDRSVNLDPHGRHLPRTDQCLKALL